MMGRNACILAEVAARAEDHPAGAHSIDMADGAWGQAHSCKSVPLRIGRRVAVHRGAGAHLRSRIVGPRTGWIGGVKIHQQHAGIGRVHEAVGVGCPRRVVEVAFRACHAVARHMFTMLAGQAAAVRGERVEHARVPRRMTGCAYGRERPCSGPVPAERVRCVASDGGAVSGLRARIIGPQRCRTDDVELDDVHGRIGRIQFTVGVGQSARIVIVAAFACDAPGGNVFHMPARGRIAVRYRRIESRGERGSMTLGACGCRPGSRPIPVERCITVTGNTRAASRPGTRIVRPETRWSSDVQNDQIHNRIAGIKSAVHMGRCVYIVCMTSLAGDSPFLKMLDVFAIGA